jgi:hypothetical protein
MEIHPVMAALIHADRRTDGMTDMTKVIVAFNNYANAPKKLNNKKTLLKSGQQLLTDQSVPRMKLKCQQKQSIARNSLA